MPLTRSREALGVLDVLERAYDVDASDRDWARALTEAVRPLLDVGAGVHGFLIDLSSNTLSHPTFAGGTEHWQERWRSAWWEPFLVSMDASSLAFMARFSPVSYTTDLFAAAAHGHPTFESLLRKRGALRAGIPRLDHAGLYPDSLNLVALDTSHRGIVFCGNREGSESERLGPRQRHVLERIGGHLASAIRLRTRVRGRADLLEHADAILDPSGKLLHASPDERDATARAALRAAAVDLDRAKGGAHAKRLSGNEALELWRALVGRRYTVVETFDTDGRRYVVARKNAPDSGAAAGATPQTRLTPREAQVLRLFAQGHSNKLIGYELDVKPSTVSTHLASIARKLDSRSLRELVGKARDYLDRKVPS